MIGIFTLAVNSETNEANWAGSIPAKVALSILQEIVINEAVKELTKKQATSTIEDKPKEVNDESDRVPE